MRKAPTSEAYSQLRERGATQRMRMHRLLLVPEVGLEPTLAEANTALNRARLPIPPLRQRDEWRVYQPSPSASTQMANPATLIAMTPLALALFLAASPSPETRLSMDVKDANVIDVVRLLAEVGGFQVVADAGVSCKLTLKLKDVEWPTVLDVALRSCALAHETQGNVVRVAPASRLLEEAAERRRLDEARQLNRPLRTDAYRLSYARAHELAPLLRRFLSPRGTVEFDARTNTLFVTDIVQ